MEQVERLKTEEEKFLAKESAIDMWRECFGDSEAYENFYFTNVYKSNTVYMIKGKGMLHLNPYRCMLPTGERVIRYIAGVGTKKQERRKGIMRKLLNQALLDMYEHKDPFTYLLPVNVQYYAPFSFVSISDREERVVNTGQFGMGALKASEWEPVFVSDGNQRIEFLEYDQLPQWFDEPDRRKLFDKVTDRLAQRYDVFMKHDEPYFELLQKEKGCQQGNVVFIFEGNPFEENLAGFFAYCMDEVRIYVEQYTLIGEHDRQVGEISAYVNIYFESKGLYPVKNIVIRDFPYMVRIVDLKECLERFKDSFYAFALEGKRLFITDPVLTGNDGIYTFSLVNDQIQVEKQEIGKESNMDEGKWDEKMTIGEMTSLLFCCKLENRIAMHGLTD